jgi:hypothetical protein
VSSTPFHHGPGPIDHGESFELTLSSDRLVARSAGDVNITAGNSYASNDAGGDIALKVRPC